MECGLFLVEICLIISKMLVDAPWVTYCWQNCLLFRYISYWSWYENDEDGSFVLLNWSVY